MSLETFLLVGGLLFAAAASGAVLVLFIWGRAELQRLDRDVAKLKDDVEKLASTMNREFQDVHRSLGRIEGLLNGRRHEEKQHER